MILRDIFTGKQHKVVAAKQAGNALDVVGVYQDGQWQKTEIKTDRQTFVEAYGRNYYMPNRPETRNGQTFYLIGSYDDAGDSLATYKQALAQPVAAPEIIPALANVLKSQPGFVVMELEIQFSGANRIMQGLRIQANSEGIKFADPRWLSTERTLTNIEHLQVSITPADFDLTLRTFGYTCERPVYSPTPTRKFLYTVAIYHGEAYEGMLEQETTVQLQRQTQALSVIAWEKTLAGNERADRLESAMAAIGIV